MEGADGNEVAEVLAGAGVRVSGLVKTPELNGRVGLVVGAAAAAAGGVSAAREVGA